MPSVLWFALRRTVRGLVTLWFAATVTFLLLRLLPGNPASTMVTGWTASGEAHLPSRR